MKYNYGKPDLSLLNMELEETILNGSFTCQPIKVATVVVDDYDDAFAGNEEPFKDIVF